MYATYYARRCRCLSPVVVVSALFLWLLAGASGEDEVPRLLSRCRQHLTSIKTIEAISTLNWEYKNSTFELKNKQNTYVLCTDGRRLRDEYHEGRSTPASTPDSVTVFDGRHVMRFDKLSNSTIKKSEKEWPIPQPMALQQCFHWLLMDTPHWNAVRSESVWADVARHSKYLGKQESMGRQFEALEVAWKSPIRGNVVYTVLLDTELNDFPTQWMRHDEGKLAATCTMIKHKSLALEEVRFIFPLESVVTYTEFSGTEPRKSTESVDESTLHINEKLQDTLFQLDPVGTVRDLDLEQR